MSPESVRTTCVVLAPQAAGASLATLDALVQERGWRRDQAGDALSAMAMLCLHHRVQSTEHSWRDPASESLPERLALVVSDAQGQSAEREAMLAAVSRFLPGVDVWRFDGAALRRESAGDSHMGNGAPLASPAAAPAPAPAAAAAAEPGDGPTTISAEELDMLLGDLPGDEP